MSPAAGRFCGLFVLWLGVELLERVAYRAGVDDAGLVADNTLAALHDDDDLAAADVSDVVEAHAGCCWAPA